MKTKNESQKILEKILKRSLKEEIPSLSKSKRKVELSVNMTIDEYFELKNYFELTKTTKEQIDAYFVRNTRR